MGMDMSKYTGSQYLRVDDIGDRPRRMVIADVFDGKFDKPVLVFDDDRRLSLNVTNTRVLARAFGDDSDGWLGRRVELYVGDLEYNGEHRPSVLVRPLGTPTAAGKTKPQSDAMDDEVPF